MARYVAIHQFPESVVLEDVLAMRKRLVKVLRGTQLQWLNSWYMPENRRLICEWLAPEVESVRQALYTSGALTLAPLLLLEEAIPTGPTDFPGEFDDV